ncbi:heme ABC exporter ATP-binding protein CcmA [Bartonella tamiae]|uniref:Heme ABC exporter, ATP-binding protein CcmA n=1 Tax=Bartonella tamiae Th239 TaxID=1094558 RepID=J0R697_9HYPH|nr:heme ABC exporter ATP-binding protein CcmA [Bartonella tamiae]EJF91234.1 heme ABC exporter, ATP-binding protein CcmA [Bartonella tamiae Th239]EJF93101.1 heme ABC exporter, ATP-binding protein CcmA [Bartonella tamiae Th307]
MKLCVKNLSAKRGEDRLFDHLSFTLNEGQLMTIIGSNGIGKSTLLRIIAGFLNPEEGNVFLTEESFHFPVSSACHYLGTQNAMKTHLSVLDNLTFWANFHDKPFLSPQDALNAVELSGVETLPFGVLSTGQKRRVAIARLLLSFHPLWILDEPTSGLDSIAVDIFTKLLKRHLDNKGMIIAATHLPLGLDVNINIALGDYLPDWEY